MSYIDSNEQMIKKINEVQYTEETEETSYE